MKKLVLIIFLFSLFSCAKREIQVPLLGEKGIQKIYDFTEVWFFFEQKGNDTIAKVNRKNTIITTHWIFNIDKKLPLKSVIPELITLQDKHKNGIHAKKGMHNYFSFADTITKTISLLDFTGITFHLNESSANFINSATNTTENCQPINLYCYNTLFVVNDITYFQDKFKKTILDLIKSNESETDFMIYLHFPKNCTFQNYMYYKTILANLKLPSVYINQNEFFDA